MGTRYQLEREYQRIEVDPDFDVKLWSVGRLLDAAIDGAPPNPAVDQLLHRMAGAERLLTLMVESTGDGLPERVSSYRDTARQCRHQARHTMAETAVVVLRDMADDYDRKADELEALLFVH